MAAHCVRFSWGRLARSLASMMMVGLVALGSAGCQTMGKSKSPSTASTAGGSSKPRFQFPWSKKSGAPKAQPASGRLPAKDDPILPPPGAVGSASSGPRASLQPIVPMTPAPRPASLANNSQTPASQATIRLASDQQENQADKVSKQLTTDVESPRAFRSILLTASLTTSGNLASLQADHHHRLGWTGINHHFLIGNGQGLPDGHIVATPRWKNQLTLEAPLGQRPDAWERQSIRLCFIGDPRTGSLTPAQRAAGKQLIAQLQRQLGISNDDVKDETTLRGWNSNTAVRLDP